MQGVEKIIETFKDKIRGKFVFCNCDDPEKSNFSIYLRENFKGKKFIMTFKRIFIRRKKKMTKHPLMCYNRHKGVFLCLMI